MHPPTSDPDKYPANKKYLSVCEFQSLTEMRCPSENTFWKTSLFFFMYETFLPLSRWLGRNLRFPIKGIEKESAGCSVKVGDGARRKFQRSTRRRKKRQRGRGWRGWNLSVLICRRDRGIEAGAVSLLLARSIPLHAFLTATPASRLLHPYELEHPIVFSTSSISN